MLVARCKIYFAFLLGVVCCVVVFLEFSIIFLVPFLDVVTHFSFS